MFRPSILSLLAVVAACCQSLAGADSTDRSRLLYVAVPGIRNDLKYGGHGLLVFDIAHDHQFLRRIPCGGIDDKGQPLNVRGICASAATGRLYISTISSLQCLEIASGKLLWEKKYDGGVDRMAITPDGRTIFAPADEKTYWNVIDALGGDVLGRIPTEKQSHNTVVGPSGTRVFLADRGSRVVQIADTATREVVGKLGPFSNVVRPFTVNGRENLLFACVDGLLGFEIGDLAGGQMIHRVAVEGFKQGPVLRHGCPSHGIGLTPDERELWVCDSANKQLHVFDATVMPPKQMVSIACRDEPGWITFSIDGRLAWPSTGDIIDVASHKVISQLADEEGRAVQSEKLLEIDFAGGKPVLAGDQFGIGRVTDPK